LRRSGANKDARFMQTKELAHHRTTQGDPVEADRLLTEAIPLASREFGSTHPYVLHLQRVLARALAEEGCFVEAETLARQTLDERLRQSMDPEGNGRTMLILGRALAQQGKLDEAQHLLQAALRCCVVISGNTDASAVLAANWLGTIQMARGAYPEAEGLLLPIPTDSLTRQTNSHPPKCVWRWATSSPFYEAWRKPEKAAAWKRRLDELPIGKPTAAIRHADGPRARIFHAPTGGPLTPWLQPGGKCGKMATNCFNSLRPWKKAVETAGAASRPESAGLKPRC